MRLKIRVKICGICCSEDARYAFACGADAIGLVFYQRSSRYVAVDAAKAICASLPPWASSVGLFMNHDEATVRRTLGAVPLACLQFHGEETPEFCAQFERPYIKAVPATALEGNGADLASWNERYHDASALLLDSGAGKKAGGSGQTLDWPGLRATLGDVPAERLVLAGGLNADNVANAFKQSGIPHLDVSSGVESSPGVKDRNLMAAFMRAALALDT